MVTQKYSAHKTQQGEYQSLLDHLQGTARLAAQFASKFGASDLAYTAGLYHDVGKYSQAFQRRLHGDSMVDHSTAGAQLLDKCIPIFGKLLAYAIAGHHSGLPDYGPCVQAGTLEARLAKDTIEDYSAYKTELPEPKDFVKFPEWLREADDRAYTLAMLTKMIYSCVVDADWLDTEAFMQKTPRPAYPKVYELLSLLTAYLERMPLPSTHINQQRALIQQFCTQKAGYAQGTYVLSAPTGSGKTLSSIIFALNHAKIHGLDRVIYVIPYISITEQTAGTLRDIFGDDYVLEHHSSYDFGDDDNLKLASENWDIPIVVTTNVQFFESLYSAVRTRNRKLHNIARSVVVFDEVQMFPVEYLKPCLRAVEELVRFYGVTALFCSATPPDFSKYYTLPIVEILPDPEKMNQEFKRTIITDIGDISLATLVGRLTSQEQVLTVVNTKKLAKTLYTSLAATHKNTFHLSTNMCPRHRSEVIAKIKTVLKAGETCRVVSTQLIEAGVNLDFPEVYREHAGLDSVIQAGGRCNREWKYSQGNVYTFGLKDVKATWPMDIYRAYSVYKELARTHSDLQVLSVVRKYFDRLYRYAGEDTLDKEKVLADLSELLEYQFKTVSDKFNLIDVAGIPVLIPYNKEAESLINSLRAGKGTYSVLRKLQQYTVSVYPEEHTLLQAKGKLESVGNLWVLKDFENNYGKNTGIILSY